ncbi:MAG: tetraacyldisaccharide 4'-kinase [Candidatus Zixiibacteriota bacterium]|nr:MAG: tetraacyldisaccharide 4'-kinase [candidate division Zixibacteria bacterium]
MSGRWRLFLWPFSLVYRGFVLLWDIYWRLAPKVKLPCKVISVGNIVAGGTGKTPIVIHIANLAARAGFKTAVVAKGYKRIEKGLIELDDKSNWLDAGDEPLEIFQNNKDVRVYVAGSKTKAARKAAIDGAELIIIDDGFQHRKLDRDVDIVCLDQTKPLGPGGYLPMGLLREGPLALKRANIIIYTSCDDLSARGKHMINMNFQAKIFRSSSSIIGFTHLKSKESFNVDDIVSKKPIAFCGICVPVKFKRSLEKVNIKPRKFICFKDHHRYTQRDIDMLKEEAMCYGADCILTTNKDAVKIGGFDFGNIDVYFSVLEIEVSDASIFEKLLGL